MSSNGTSACFIGTAPRGVKSNVAITPGGSSFYYFEATRSSAVDLAFGVSEAALDQPASGSAFVARADTVVVSGSELQSADASGVAQTVAIGDASVFGFAVDFRAQHPIVSVIGPASADASGCAPLAGSAPCVLFRWQMSAAATALNIYAYGSGTGATGPRVTLNSGSDLAAKPFAYSTVAVMTALRTQRIHGDLGLDAQWPGPSGPAAQPILTPLGHDRLVARKNEASLYRTNVAVSAANANASDIEWRDEAGALLGSGASLPLSPAQIDALAIGEHLLTASVTNAAGRYAAVSFRLLVISSVSDTDDDGDGLTYSDESALGTDPGNADSDGDGLSDGAEAGLGNNPLVADNPNPANLPLRGALAWESGVTSSGVIIADDGLSAIFTGELNPECVAHVGIFADPVYTSPYGASERCEKRAVRANVGIQPGEFRYFESQRLDLAQLDNVGQGIITAGGMIDPYCCFVDPSEPSYPFAGTPPSLTINSVGGVFVRLENAAASFSPQPFDLAATTHYGFAVDYTGADPKVYLVVTAADGTTMTVSDAITVTGFGGGPVMPMLHGHVMSETVPSLTLNLGLQKFHHDPVAVRAAIEAKGTSSMANFVPGVGIHRWTSTP